MQWWSYGTSDAYTLSVSQERCANTTQIGHTRSEAYETPTIVEVNTGPSRGLHWGRTHPPCLGKESSQNLDRSCPPPPPRDLQVSCACHKGPSKIQGFYSGRGENPTLSTPEDINRSRPALSQEQHHDIKQLVHEGIFCLRPQSECEHLPEVGFECISRDHDQVGLGKLDRLNTQGQRPLFVVNARK